MFIEKKQETKLQKKEQKKKELEELDKYLNDIAATSGTSEQPKEEKKE